MPRPCERVNVSQNKHAHAATDVQASTSEDGQGPASPVNIAREDLGSFKEKLDQSLQSMKIHLSNHERIVAETFYSLSQTASYVPNNSVEFQDRSGDQVPNIEAPKSEEYTPMQQNLDHVQVAMTKRISHIQSSLVAEVVKETLPEDQQQEQHGLFASLRHIAQRIISHPWFEYMVSIMILTNCVLIGVETHMSTGFYDKRITWPNHAETFSLGFYIIEISCRALAGGKDCLRDMWFCFDLTLILIGVTGKAVGMLGITGSNNWWQQLFLIRMFRLFRLIRALRMVRLFNQMWNLVYGLMTSLNVMISTFGLLAVSLYGFACVGVDLITNDTELANHSLTSEIVDYHFGNLFRTMLTLVQFVTMDSIAAVYVPLCYVKPGLIIYFVLILLVISISLMNIITAALVEGVLANASQNKLSEQREMKSKLKKLLPTIAEVFQQIDQDSSGMITLEEARNVRLSQLPRELTDKVSVETMTDLFDVLDTDSSGELSQEEFVQGLLNISLLDVPLPIVQILKLCKLTSEDLKHVTEDVHLLKRVLQI